MAKIDELLEALPRRPERTRRLSTNLRQEVFEQMQAFADARRVSLADLVEAAFELAKADAEAGAASK